MGRGTPIPALAIVALAGALSGSTAGAQPVPQPFPRAGETRPASGPQAAPATPPQPASQTQPAPTAGAATATPDEAMLGVPLYPTAQYIGSFDAGFGQRYYLFGATAPFTDLVTYYRNVLRSRGDVVFERPPVHIFETGRYRQETMAFPPSVTIKDYTWGGSQGYLVALPGGKSQRFPTVIQIVPAAPGDRR